jgi:hypothetical protein
MALVQQTVEADMGIVAPIYFIIIIIIIIIIKIVDLVRITEAALANIRCLAVRSPRRCATRYLSLTAIDSHSGTVAYRTTRT